MFLWFEQKHTLKCYAKYWKVMSFSSKLSCLLSYFRFWTFLKTLNALLTWRRTRKKYKKCKKTHFFDSYWAKCFDRSRGKKSKPLILGDFGPVWVPAKLLRFAPSSWYLRESHSDKTCPTTIMGGVPFLFHIIQKLTF